MTLAQAFERRGMEKRSEEIALSMLKEGCDIEFISNITEVSLPVLKKMQEKMFSLVNETVSTPL